MWQLIIDGMKTLLRVDNVEITGKGNGYTDVTVMVGEEKREFTVYRPYNDVKVIPPAQQTLEPVFPGVPEHPALDYRLPV